MKRIKNRSIFILLTIILSLGITLGAVYYMYQYKDSRENKLATSMISINFTEKSNVINLTSNVPMIDDLGLKGTPYEFSITNTSTVPVKANIKLDVDNDTTIKYGAVRYALFINNERVIKDYLHRDNLTLYEVSELKPNEVINCKLYFWIDYYYDYPGEAFKAKIKAVGESIDNLQQEAITVTFDADGGVLDTTTKEVYYHGYYGELPTPTKEGYTFMGWNGKNLFNIDNVMDSSTIVKNGNTILFDGSATSGNTSGSIRFQEFNNNTYISELYGCKLQIGLCTRSFTKTSDFNRLYIKENTNKSDPGFFINDINFQNNQQYTISLNIDSYNTSMAQTTISNLQIEEGSVATEYEPYYIRSNTRVVKTQDHTLKAIWKENS